MTFFFKQKKRNAPNLLARRLTSNYKRAPTPLQRWKFNPYPFPKTAHREQKCPTHIFLKYVSSTPDSLTF